MAIAKSIFKTFAYSIAGLVVLGAIVDKEEGPKTQNNIIGSINGGADKQLTTAFTDPPLLKNADNEQHHEHNHGTNAATTENNLANYLNPNQARVSQDLRKNLENAGNEVSQHAKYMYEDASSKVAEAKKKLEDCGNGKFWAEPDQALKEQYEDAKVTFDNVMNSVKNAQYYSSEKFQNAVDAIKNYQLSTEERIKSNSEFYHRQAKEAKAEWESTKSSFWKWRKAQSQEIQDEAEKRYTYFKTHADAADKDLVKYLQSQANSAKGHVDSVKDYAADVKDYAAENLKIKDKAAKDFQNNIKDFGSDMAAHAKNMYDDASSKLKDAKKKLEDSDDGKIWAEPDKALQEKFEEAKKGFENVMQYIGNVQYYNSDKFQDAIDAIKDYQSSTEDKLKSNAELYKKSAEQAKKEWDDTKSSWLSWKKAEATEVQDRAEARYKYFKQQSDEAYNTLFNYLSKQADSVKESLSDLDIGEDARKQARDAKDKIVQVAYDNAEYAKHYVAEAKDHASQVGYNAKEKIQDDVDYAKVQAAAGKDRIANAGADVKNKIQHNVDHAMQEADASKESIQNVGSNIKDNIQDNAEYAKHYIGGQKDRVIQAGYDAKEDIKDKADYVKHYVGGVKDQAVQVGYDGTNEAEGYVSGAMEWLGRAGNVAKDYLSDKYQSMWNNFGVFSATTKEVAEEAVRYYDEEVEKAKAEYDQTQASWLKWRHAKEQEIQDQAKSQWEIMKAKDEAARKELERWSKQE